MADFNFLDSKITTDTVNKKVTLNFTSLRGTFSLTPSSVSTIGTANGIYLKINFVASSTGTTTFSVDLRTLGLPSGSYSFVECEITGTLKSPSPKQIVKGTMNI